MKLVPKKPNNKKVIKKWVDFILTRYFKLNKLTTYYNSSFESISLLSVNKSIYRIKSLISTVQKKANKLKNEKKKVLKIRLWNNKEFLLF